MLFLLYVTGSLLTVPVLAYHLVRTRRELRTLREALVARGLLPSNLEATRDGSTPASLVRTVGAGAPPGEGAGLQTSVDAIALEVERIAEAQRFLTKLLAERGATSEPVSERSEGPAPGRAGAASQPPARDPIAH